MYHTADSEDDKKSKFTHDAPEEAVSKLKADTFHERQYEKTSGNIPALQINSL